MILDGNSYYLLITHRGPGTELRALHRIVVSNLSTLQSRNCYLHFTDEGTVNQRYSVTRRTVAQ